ncbi:tetratricopeptide repeat protein [uncultured Psychroserpens sp.]|uniref:tetratricopeptide repeat protein n=1 Tax=uncultured Psychroserpens sp. TaxID=255436 RepID=UPI002626F142|nr:tetratricopeptide repeat protein [uncultured Psychroserpens sp.]
MEANSRVKNVLIFRFLNYVYLEVDISVLLISVFLISQVSFSQDQKRVDSLLQAASQQTDTTQIITYAHLFADYIYVDPLKAKPYLDSTMVLANRLGNKSFIARTTNYLGVYYNFTSDYRKADSTLSIVIEQYAEIGDSIQMCATMNNKAIALKSLGNYREALETHMQSLKLKEQLNDTEESIAASYWNIGNLQGDIGNYEASNTYYNKAKVIFEKLDLEQDLKSINNNIAINLSTMGHYEESIPLFLDAIAYNKANNYNNDLAGAYDNIGSAYYNLDSIAIAKSYYEKSLAISQNYGETSLTGLNYRHLGEVYMKENKPRIALDYFKKALKISEETGTSKKMITDYLRLSQAYSAVGQFEKAYQNHVSYHKLHDDILNEENIERMNQLEISYQTEKKEKELAIQKGEIDALKQKEEISKNRQRLLGIGSLSLLLFAGALFYGLRQKMKRNKLEREQLDTSLRFKEKELTTHALHLAHKNEVLLDLKAQLKELKSDSPNSRSYQNVINTINLDINNDSNWEQFRTYFEDVHKDFNANVKRNYPEVSANDLRLMSLLKMNLSTKEIANILNISTEGVKKARYRLRKKLNLATEDSLQELVIDL